MGAIKAILKAGNKAQYIDSWDFRDRQLTQEQAGYSAYGATDAQGCANCQWFVAPSACSVVAGEISPTGSSNLWMAKQPYAQTPILVQIVDPTDAEMGDTMAGMKSADADGSSRGGLLDRVMSAVKSAFVPNELGGSGAALGAVPGDTTPTPEHPFKLFKTKENRLRFVTAWSNNFRDRQGEIFTEQAHKDYIQWADDNQQYPELLLWHTPGTGIGQVDWLDYTDGFVYASGLIKEGSEATALNLAKEDCGVSHGFNGWQVDDTIVSYRSWEVSVLPRDSAAVPTTSFNIIGEEGAKEMAFTQKKKDFLKAQGLGDDAIAAYEVQATNLSKALREAGVDYKDNDLEPDAAPPAAAATPPAATPPAATEGAKASEVTELKEMVEKLGLAMGGLAETVKSIDGRVKSVEKTEDERVAEAITAPAVGQPRGVEASKDAGNVDNTTRKANADWFNETFVTDLVKAGG